VFSVIFEVHPRPERWDAYLGNAKMLRPELEQVDGFIDNIRYKSLTRAGWVLSLSGWRDEKAVVRWRTGMRHHLAQEKGRAEILLDYHLRVGEIIQDTRIPDGHVLAEQRFDETEVGEATTVTLIDAKQPAQRAGTSDPAACSNYLGLDPSAAGLIGWDVFDAVLTPGDLILLLSWRGREHAQAFEHTLALPEGGRLRQVRIIRDYGMFDRREAPQYYPEVARLGTGA
jgi:heme-degrading monooxygenase HmoA